MNPVRVRRAKWGWRERVVVMCGHCGAEFTRLRNTRYCSDLCRLLGKVHVDDASGCWLWSATLDRHGYGTFWLNDRRMRAHRASLLLHGIPLTVDKHVDHLCRRRACVNPQHLEPVTQAENNQRAWDANRPTHCKRDHEFTPENTRHLPNGTRNCLTCIRDLGRERARRYRAERKASAA